MHLINVFPCVKRLKAQGISVSKEWKVITLSNQDLVHLTNVWSCVKRCESTNTYFLKRNWTEWKPPKIKKSRLSILCLISTPLKSIFFHLKKVIFVEWFFRPLEFNYVQENKFLLDSSYFFQAHIIILKPCWNKLLNSCSFLEDCEWNHVFFIEITSSTLSSLTMFHLMTLI